MAIFGFVIGTSIDHVIACTFKIQEVMEESEKERGGGDVDNKIQSNLSKRPPLYKDHRFIVVTCIASL